MHFLYQKHNPHIVSPQKQKKVDMLFAVSLSTDTKTLLQFDCLLHKIARIYRCSTLTSDWSDVWWYFAQSLNSNKVTINKSNNFIFVTIYTLVLPYQFWLIFFLFNHLLVNYVRKKEGKMKTVNNIKRWNKHDKLTFSSIKYALKVYKE